MKRLLLETDFHVIVLGAMISLIFIFIVSMISFAPSDPPRFLSVIGFCSIPFLISLEPMIITGTIDRRKNRANAIRYFTVNTLVALTFGIICGAIVFAVLPRKSSQGEMGKHPEFSHLNQQGKFDEPTLSVRNASTKQ